MTELRQAMEDSRAWRHSVSLALLEFVLIAAIRLAVGAGALALTWTLFAFGEQLVFRGYRMDRIACHYPGLQ